MFYYNTHHILLLIWSEIFRSFLPRLNVQSRKDCVKFWFISVLVSEDIRRIILEDEYQLLLRVL